MSHFSACLGALVLIACGGDKLVLPSEGTAASIAPSRGNNQQGTVGAPLPDSLQVVVLDRSSRPVQGQPVAWSVVVGNGSIAPATSTTDAQGRAAARWTLGTGSGAQQALAVPTGNGAAANLQAVFTATAGAATASRLALVSGDGQTAVAGTALPDSLVVSVVDAASNPVAGVQVAWTLTGGGAVSSPTTPTGANGRAAVRRTLGATAGPQTTTATVAGLTGSPIVFTATATVGSAGRLVIVRQPSATAANGAPFGQQPTVQIQDANGNDVATAGLGVEAAIASNPGGGALVGTIIATTGAGGLATFQDLGISGPTGSYTLNFSVPNRGDISGTPPSNAITISAGSAARLRFQVQPSSIAAGGSISPAVTVQVQDALGNPVTGAGSAVTLGLGNNPGGATLAGTTTVNAVAGLATFANLSLNRPGSGYTLAATAPGLSGDASSPFNVVTGAASQISANSATSLSGTAGTAVSPRPSVKVTDGSGNPVAGVNVTFAVGSGGGSVSGATQTSDVAGIATVGSWTLGPVAGVNNNRMTATATGLAGSPVTFTATATVGTEGKLSVTQQPSLAPVNGRPFAQQPEIQLEDSSGNPLNTGGLGVKAEFATSQAGATLDGNLTAFTDSGRATFTDLGITGVVGSYSLKFSVPNRSDITGTVSGTITLVAGTATTIAANATMPPSQTVGTLVNPAPSVKVTDASGNPVSGVSVTFAVTAGGGTATAPVVVTTLANGIATANGWTLGTTAGVNRMTATATGLTGSPVTFSVTGTAGPATTIAANATMPPSQTVGTLVSPAPSVKVTDASGNPVGGVSVTFAVTAGGGSVSGAAQLTNASGIATVGGWTLGTTAGPNTMRATATGLTGSPVTFSVTGTAGTATTVAANSVMPPSQTVGTLVSPAPSVKVTDASGNPVGGVNVTFAVTAGGGTVTAPAVVATLANGIATTNGWTLGTTAGPNTMRATATGLAGNPVTFTVNGTAGTAAKLAVTTQPSTVVNGQVLTPSPVIQIQDANGNPVGTTGVNVTVSVQSGGGVLGGTVTVPTVSGGTATFTDLTITGLVGSRTLRFRATPLTDALSAPISVTVGPVSADSSTVAATPATFTAGSPTGSTVTVTAKDQSGNLIQGAPVIPTQVTGGSFEPAPPPTPITGANGQVTLTFKSTVAGSYVISASAAGTLIALTDTVTVSAAPAATIAANATMPSSATAGTLVSPAPSVRVTDAFGNPVSGVSVTFQVTAGGGTPLIPEIIATQADGIATTSGWTLGLLPGPNQMRATAAVPAGSPVIFSVTGT